MNGVDVWLAYQGITRTAEIQADFYNYLAEEMIQRVKGRRRTIVESDDDYVNDRTHCLAGSMVLPDVEFLYMSDPLIRGGRRGIVQRLNTCFKASARSAGRRRHVCVQIVQT